MRYEEILDRTPKSTTAGDRYAARTFVQFLDVVFADEGQLKELTISNRNYLYKLRAKWQLRADGKDERWNTFGSAPGRPKMEHADRQPRVRRRHTDDEFEHFDDLSKRIIERYRKIRPEDQ